MRIKFFIFVFLLSALITSTDLFARSRLRCSTLTNNNSDAVINNERSRFSSGSGCYFADMPRYNQRDSRIKDSMFPDGDHNQSKLCAPTSASMALAAVTMDDVSYYVNSWTYRSFVNQPMAVRIKNFADLMGTNYPNGGTGWNGQGKFSDRASDIPEASKTRKDADDFTLNRTYFKERVDKGDVGIVSYGHYTQNCDTTILGNKICTYARDGGHLIALNGYYSSGSLIYTRIHDPWGNWGSGSDRASIKYNLIKELPEQANIYQMWGLSLDFRPHLNKTRYLYQSGTQIKIIDGYNGINTNL